MKASGGRFVLLIQTVIVFILFCAMTEHCGVSAKSTLSRRSADNSTESSADDSTESAGDNSTEPVGYPVPPIGLGPAIPPAVGPAGIKPRIKRQEEPSFATLNQITSGLLKLYRGK